MEGWLSSTMTVNSVDGLVPFVTESLSIRSMASLFPPHGEMASPCTPHGDVVEMAVASSLGLKAPLDSSGLFNPDVPDLSFCVPAELDIIKTESDQYLTVDVSELFPDLMGLHEVSAPDDSKPIAVGALNLGSISEEPSDAEVSPAETEASLDHFFNTFTDLTGFLENLSEGTGPTNLDDNSAVLAGNANTTDNTGEPSIGDLCTSADDPAETEEPPAKRACNLSEASTRSRQTYRERRNKNNVASRVSRSRRKNKNSGLEQRAMDLETDNEQLRNKIEELTKIAEESRKSLISVLQNK